ncbi:hypothetical protein HDU78_004408 [Chytriomyces hyalinus]|nr:hypothetical protein HDU78_004408 [Chytriomyces hyalinus]
MRQCHRSFQIMLCQRGSAMKTETTFFRKRGSSTSRAFPMPPKPKKKFVPLGNAAQSPREGLEGTASSNAGASQRSARQGPTPSEALSHSLASTNYGGAGAVLAPHPAAIKAAEEAESILLSPQEGDHCFICTDPISWYAVGECNHRVCHLCSLRLRALLKDNNCSMCKTPLSDVIFTGDSSKPFSDFSLNRMAKVDRKLSIHFDSVEAYDDVMILLRFNCPDSDCDVACAQGWPELKKHVRQTHNKFLCDLCTRHKRLFTHEHTMYTQAELDRHFKTGDPNDSSFKGHPKCGFCKIHFYGDDELYEHCRKQHEQCFLCTSAGIRHQYYENYDALEKHFRKEHFCCMDPECLEKKFQVFFSDIDLKAHEMQVHSTKRMGRGKGQKIDINFSIAGSPSLDLGSRAGSGSGGGRGGGSGGGGGGRNNRRRGDDNRESDRNQDEEDRAFGSRSGLQAPAGFGSQLSQSQPAPTPAESVNGLQRQPSGDYPSIQSNYPSAVASNGPAARYASSVAGGIAIDRSDMSFPLPGRVLDRSENNFPPPARAVTQPSNSASSSSANSSGSMMDAGTLKTLQELFDSDASKLDQLKSIAKMYKSDLTTCAEFLNFFISLVFEGRHGASEPVKREIVGKAGKVWRALADSIPDEEMGSKVSQRDRKSNASKREEMLRVWNDYKVKNDSNFSNPYLESSYANPVSKSGAASSNSRSSGSGGSPTQSARVLVIKSKATHQRNTPMWNAMSKGKGFVSSLEDSRKQQPAFDTGSSSSSSGSGPEFRTGLSAAATTTPLQPQQGQQQQQQMWGSSPAPAKSAANEFPGLPSRPNVIPAYVKKGASSSINEWSADGGSSYGSLNENQGAQSSQGGKKKKKEKIVLMKVGL